MDALEFRDCMGRFATGVTIVTTSTETGFHGATVNAFTSVSIDPPLVLVSLSRTSRLSGHVATGPFVVNVLADGQRELATHFAGRPSLDSVDWVEDGPVAFGPALHGCLANIYCDPWQVYDGGDHLLVIGEVRGIRLADGDPLLFYRGSFLDAAMAVR